MAKGITPVIAIILLLLITIAIIGFTTLFLQSSVESSGSEAESAATATANRLQQTIKFVAASPTSITVQNIGSADIPGSAISFLVNGVAKTCTLSPTGDIAPGATVSCTAITCNANGAISVSAPGNTDTGTCPP